MENSKPTLEVEVLGGAPPVVRLCGEVDFHSKDRLCEVFDRLVDEGHERIHADLSGLFYTDSSALSALVRCASRAADAGSSIELLSVSERVSRLLTLCGAAAFFRWTDADVPSALNGASAAPSEGFWHVSDFSLPSVPGAAGIARGRLLDVVRALPISAADRQDVIQAAGEALANAIKHGCKCDPDQRIHVNCVAGHGRLAISISDTGAGFDPSAIPVPVAKDLPLGGMGIYLMRRLMDEVLFSFVDGRTTVRLVKYIACATQTQPMPIKATASVI